MNDLDVLRDLAPDAPLLSITELSVARERVLAEVTQGRHSFRPAAAERRWAKRRGPARRIAIGGVTVAAAAAITAGVLVATNKTTPAVVTVPATLTARQVLEHAAGAALKESAVVPREDQFVYTKDVSPGGVVQLSWLSVGGTRDGLTESPMNGKMQKSVQLGCVNGVRKIRTPGRDGKPLKGGHKPIVAKKPVPMDGPVVTVPCTPERAYFPDMPTTAAAMGPYLERTQGIRTNDLNDLSKTVGFMLESDYIRPAQRAALYRYLAATPGLTVERHVHDVSGRSGIGVVWHFYGSKAMNIFDPRTFAYLGMTTWGEQGQEGGAALVRTAIVNQAGELP
ncbi:MAG: CU044_5270 family protein [Jatrophihabitantaceae bacterium]